MNMPVDAPETFFSNLGGLHDADIKRLVWEADKHVLCIDVDDLHANWSGLPEYLGPKPASLVFVEVRNIDFRYDLSSQDCLRIFGIDAKQANDMHSLTIRLSPSGLIRLDFDRLIVGAIDISNKGAE